MPDFAYTARDATGKSITGQLHANSRQDAVATLNQQSLFPVKVEVHNPAAAWRLSKRVKPQLVATMYSQLGDLLTSGVPMLRSLDVLARQSIHPHLREVQLELKSRVEEGQPLADSMQRHPRVFDEMAVSMIRAGSEGGFLEAALERVSQFTEQQEDLKSRVKGALAYPVFLSVLGTLIVASIMIFLVPKFGDLFVQLREQGELPWLTEVLFGVSDVIRTWGLVVLVLAIIGYWFARSKLKTPEGRYWLDGMRIRLPNVGPIYLNLAVARFCRVLGTLLKNGVPILKSLNISAEATGNKVLAKAIVDAAESISGGESLAQPLASSGHFPPAVVEMIAVAEEANSLDSVLVTIADGLERRTWRQLDLFVRLLEPIMLLVLAVVVLLVVVALLLPIMKMSASFS